jgi:hypothetical protein
MVSSKLWPVSTCSRGRAPWPGKKALRAKWKHTMLSLPPLKSKGGIVELGGHLPQDVHALAFEFLQVGQSVGMHGFRAASCAVLGDQMSSWRWPPRVRSAVAMAMAGFSGGLEGCADAGEVLQFTARGPWHRGLSRRGPSQTSKGVSMNTSMKSCSPMMPRRPVRRMAMCGLTKQQITKARSGRRAWPLRRCGGCSPCGRFR